MPTRAADKFNWRSMVNPASAIRLRSASGLRIHSKTCAAHNNRQPSIIVMIDRLSSATKNHRTVDTNLS